MPPRSLCTSFRSLAKQTWSQLRRARSAGLHLGETGITDRLLIELKLSHPSEVTIVPFSQRDEATTGADWEWWLVGQSRKAIGFRIQAKVIHHRTRRYSSLHYRSYRDGIFQCDKLIRSALAGQVPTIPLYCLYTEWARIPLLPNWPCGTFPRLREELGCALLSPFVVRRMQTPALRDALGDVLPELRPWHCLVCCGGFGGDSLPERALSFYRGAVLGGDQLMEADGDEWSKVAALQAIDELPTHVQNAHAGYPVAAPDPELAGLVVVRERANP